MSAADGNMAVGNSSGNAWDDYIRRGFEVGAGTCLGQVSAPAINFSQPEGSDPLKGRTDISAFLA